MDSLTLACVLSDLSRRIGERVRAVHADGRLCARMQLASATVRIDATPGEESLFLLPADEGGAGDRQASAFAESLRASLSGAELAGVAQPAGDRVARLSFVANRFGALRRHTLIVELMGKYANAFLLGEEGTIEFCAREMNAQARGGGVGSPWRPFGERLPLRDLAEADLAALPGWPDSPDLSPLMRRYAGLHPELVAELAALPPGEIAPALRALGRFYATLDPADLPFPVAFATHRGKVTARRGTQGSASPPVFPSASEALASALYARREAAELRSTLATVGERIRRTETFLALARRDVAGAASFERFRHAADLMLAFPDRIVRLDAERITVPDYDGTPVEVALDPRFDLKGNRERLYRRYKRLRKTHETALARVASLEAEFATLQSARQAAERGEPFALPREPESGRDARRTRKKGEAERAAKRTAAKKRAANSADAARKFYRQERAESGHAIYIGRNARGNDYVTTRLARPWDLWFHAKGVRGSHVVLRIERDEEPPESAVHHAARAAAFSSDARTGSRILVSMARRRDIRKVPGTPGLVLLNKEETLLVEPGEGE